MMPRRLRKIEDGYIDGRDPANPTPCVTLEPFNFLDDAARGADLGTPESILLRLANQIGPGSDQGWLGDLVGEYAEHLGVSRDSALRHLREKAVAPVGETKSSGGISYELSGYLNPKGFVKELDEKQWNAVEPALATSGRLAPSEREQLLDLLKKYFDIFRLSTAHFPIKGKKGEIRLKPEHAGEVVSQRNRRVRPTEVVQVGEEMEKMRALNLTSPSKSPHNAPLVIVAKKDGNGGRSKIRVCYDYVKINAVTEDIGYSVDFGMDAIRHAGQQAQQPVRHASGFHAGATYRGVEGADRLHLDNRRAPGTQQAPVRDEAVTSSVQPHHERATGRPEGTVRVPRHG